MKGKYVMCRTYSAGVFAGVLKQRKGKETTLTDARRIWKWAGAATLSELSMEGTKKPEECKFGVAVSEVLLTETIELILISKVAEKSIRNVPKWNVG